MLHLPSCKEEASRPKSKTRSAAKRCSASILERPAVGEPLIIASWRTGGKGRKHFAGTALYTKDGTLLAHADTLWFAVDTAQFEQNA